MIDTPDAPSLTVRPPARVVLQGRVSLTALSWSVWTSVLLLALLVMVLGRPTFLIVTTMVVLGTASVLLHVRHVTRAARWVLLLDDRRLTIDRAPPLAARVVESLDVNLGVRLDVVGDHRALRVDAAISIETADRRVVWAPGIPPAQAMDCLATFLRANDVSVTVPANAAVGWVDEHHRWPG